MPYDFPKFVLSATGDMIPESNYFRWARWMCDLANRTVERTKLSPHVTVSTIFLGHNRGTAEAPVYFQSLILGGPLDGTVANYETYRQAIEGHLTALGLAMHPPRIEEA